MGKWGGKKAILEMMNRVVSVHNGGAVHLILGIIAIFMAHKRGGLHSVAVGRDTGPVDGVGDGKCLERSGSQLEEKPLISLAPVSTSDCIPFSPTRVD